MRNASLVPAQSAVASTDWRANGLGASLTNRGWVTIEVRGRGCDGRSANLDRWMSGAWVEVENNSLTLLCVETARNNEVAAGVTLPVYAWGAPPDTGRYRLRLATSAGDVISAPIEVR